MSERLSSKVIDQHAERLCKLAKDIWDNPEMGWTEKKAVEWTAEYLRSEGFETEVGAYGMPTAIRAVWGKGHPVIGFAAEYDCLPGLSQKVCSSKDPVVPGGIGHGCGHNLLGVGCLGAVIGLKAELEASGKDGTVIFYGCPAEEQLTGKGFMAKAGAFYECDFNIAWHPGATNQNTIGVMNGVEAGFFRFHGKTSHAAANPQDGRSALDAVQLMNIGSEFLREHVTSDVRIHYVITNGGLAPNIVPDYAESKFFVRALTREAVVDTFNRLIKCAEGAAHMTETTLEIERLGGIYPTMQNKVMANIMQKVREELPDVEYTEEELKFADEINRAQPQYVEGVTPPIDYKNKPLVAMNGGASTDYGDVMHICPSVANIDCTAATLSGGHSWMVTACSGSSIGMKGMIRAAKVMAGGAWDLICDPEAQAAAKAEFDEAMAGKQYECPITDDVKWPYND
ncbi:MAG: amidohydrolase [Mogibacterium sp.]|nr:amidohydrolase [Oscillospiraceae bacterium]MBR3124585.1 amidohydrolase [Mogibacterium sp.]